MKTIDFFDNKIIEEYLKRARLLWSETAEYKEYEDKSKSRNNNEQESIATGLMKIFVEFGQLMDIEPDSETVQNQVATSS